MRVLVVEDDPDLAELLRDGLTEEGYAVDLSLDGEDGLWRATTVDYDAAVLDILLPIVDGVEILRRMRKRGRLTPVVFLTARDAVDDIVGGLDLGADDYMVKPFAWDELLARLRVLIRRGPREAPPVLRHDDLELDVAKRVALRAGKPVDLTAMEFAVLHLLMREPGRVFTRTEIFESIYDDDHEGLSNTVEVFLSRLRRKLGPEAVRTVRGAGYALGGGRNAQP
jgi:two-component system OmpR family response regulator